MYACSRAIEYDLTLREWVAACGFSRRDAEHDYGQVIGVKFALWLVGTGPVCIHVRASQLFNAGRELQWHDTKSVVVDSESSHTRVALLENNEKPF
jgi:hypothetical protein